MIRLRARVLTAISPTELQFIDDALVVIDGDLLHTVGPYDGAPVHDDLRPAVLLPGFVDAHIHYPQTRIVGSASGPLLDWLAKSTFPEEARFADVTHAERVADLFVRTLARSGTTLAMAYGSVHAHAADALFSAAERHGLRMIAGPVLMDAESPPELIVPAEVALPAVEALVERWHGKHGRLQVAVIPRFALSCTRAMMRGAATLADKHQLWVTTHLAENQVECQIARDRFNAPDYLAIYEDAGLLHPRSVYAHCIHLSDDEWDRFARAGAVVAHCPDSNDFLGSGSMPVGAVLSRGIPLALGTDVAAGRSFRVPHVASRAYDNALRTGHQPSLAQLLWWATRGGALALGQPQLGSLEAGLEADMTLWDVPEWVSDADGVIAAVLFAADSLGPVRTYVAGDIVWDAASVIA